MHAYMVYAVDVYISRYNLLFIVLPFSLSFWPTHAVHFAKLYIESSRNSSKIILTIELILKNELNV